MPDAGFEIWPHPYQVDHCGLVYLQGGGRAASSWLLRSASIRARPPLLVSAVGVRHQRGIDDSPATEYKAQSFCALRLRRWVGPGPTPLYSSSRSGSQADEGTTDDVDREVANEGPHAGVDASWGRSRTALLTYRV